VVGPVSAQLVFFGEKRPVWQAHAACAELPTDDFFPVGSTGPALDRIAAAKAICAICPVVKECLEYALDTGQTDGIWGGMSEEERRSHHRRQRRERRS
jgi:WhiB family transcriptional regulator, redox-sensing transcriptional regulator